ncbi:vicilin-like seed storage protein At2g18540 [Coffea eugenioides]|uniref:vicilin-like seed storage protein At2g18540 n=1 Tax=Coffea eugenioides TaxID=49369 RepID=UPI000F60EBE1|nr:vicilin-like seed storage protein At2g18540 [Coffea eugenioides]
MAIEKNNFKYQGQVVSTKPVSLSSAAKNLSAFASLEEENGASDAVRVYLKRASDAFNNLVQFHKELKAPHSNRKRKASQPLVVDTKIETLATVDKNPDEEKIKNVKSKGKRKKNRELEVNDEEPLKIEKDKGRIDEVNAVKRSEKKEKHKKNREFEPSTEGLLKIGQEADRLDKVKVQRSSDKNRKDKRAGQSELRNEEREQIEHSPDGVGEERKKKKHDKIVRGEDTEERDEGRNKAKQEIVEVERNIIDGVEGESVKRKDKKKKKKDEGEEDGENVGKKGKKNSQSEVRSEQREQIERSPDSGVGEERKKKKQEKIGRGEDREEIDKVKNNTKQEIVEIERDMDGVEGVTE